VDGVVIDRATGEEVCWRSSASTSCTASGGDDDAPSRGSFIEAPPPVIIRE